MKKIFVALFLLVSFVAVMSVSAEQAYADQGVYGTVYAWADGSNDCYVQNAVVTIYNNSGQFVTQTTASSCGYYSVALAPGVYHLVVGGNYNERRKGSCGTIVATEYVAGDTWVTILSGFWNQEDINTL